jgi:hypothetical protein
MNMSRSVIYVANTGAQIVEVGGTISLGGIVRRYGCGIDLNGNAINVTDSGYYDVNVSVTAEPTAAGTVTATLFSNGVAVPGATASASVGTAGDPLNLSFETVVRVPCCGSSDALSVILTGSASTVTNIATVVEKL